MIEAIANDVLAKLNVSPSNDFKDFVGMDNHIAKMSVLLDLESQEVRMVGIWGTSGIGKTSIGRFLFTQHSRHFQGSVFIDRAFVSKSMEIYKSANPDDYNMKLHLLSSFLSEVLKKKDIMVDSLGAMEERLRHLKVLIVIDDLEDQMVLDTLVGQTQWFGSGSRIIVITKDKQFLRAHGIDHIYEVCLPSDELALEMFSRFCFRQNCPPDGLMEFASEVALYAGNLPLGLKVLGSYLRGRDREDLIEMLPELRNGLDGKIEKTLRVSYDGLNGKKDQAIFRHIACLFNGETVNAIKMLLADSELNVNIGLTDLVDKSLIHVRDDIVEMHSLLQEMGKEIVRAQSSNPGEREFLMDSKDICDVLQYNGGTEKVLGIALDMDEIQDELHVHENAFRGMRNLLFLNIYTKEWNQMKRTRWRLHEGFDYLPDKLRLLRLDEYPMKYMPSNFRPENLVKLEMPGSNLERLWEGVHVLRGLKEINLEDSIHLKEIPDLSMATNLEKLILCNCSSLVELPSSIQSLNKLEKLIMVGCSSLETLPNGINLQSLYELNLLGCSGLNIFPNISTNISSFLLSGTRIEELPCNLHLENLNRLDMCDEKYWKRNEPLTHFMDTLSHSLKRLTLSEIPSLVQLPSSIQNFTQLMELSIRDCINLETLPTGINLKCLAHLSFRGCSRLKTFPNIATNVRSMNLDRTGIEEVPWWIHNFSKLEHLYMNGCNNLQSVSLHLSKLRRLLAVDFTECRALSEASSNYKSSDVAMETDNYHSKTPYLDKSSSSFSQNLINCWQPAGFPKHMLLTGEEVLSYFNHRTVGSSMTNIPLFHSVPSPPFFRFKVCAVVDNGYFSYNIDVTCRFNNRLGNHFGSSYSKWVSLREKMDHLVIFECTFRLPGVNYDHVDIHINLRRGLESRSGLKEWCIRLSDEFSSQENQLGNRITPPDVCEANENNMISEVEHITESEDSDEETKRSNKRIQTTQEEHSSTTLPWIPLSILFLFGAVVAMFYLLDYLKGPL